MATGLGGFAANYFLPRESSFDFTSPKDVVALMLFTVTGAIISGLGELVHRERRRVVDITEHMRSVQALQESEQRWRSLTEALPQLVWTAMPDGGVRYFSMQWTQHTGVPENRLLGWQWMDTLHPDDREPTRKFWLDSVAGRGPYDVEYRFPSGEPHLAGHGKLDPGLLRNTSGRAQSWQVGAIAIMAKSGFGGVPCGNGGAVA